MALMMANLEVARLATHHLVTVIPYCHPLQVPSSAWQKSKNIPWGLQHFPFCSEGLTFHLVL